MKSVRIVLGAGCALLAACGSAMVAGDVPRDDGRSSAPSFVVGVGKDAYRPTPDGTTVEIIHGPQGGYHLWGAFRATGIAPGTVTVTYDVSRDVAPPEPLSSTTYQVEPFAHAGGREWAGLIGYVPNDRLSATASGPVVLSMTLTDAAGVVLHDERHLVAGPIPP